jgi:ABC-type enterochelin transport system substrate-binding protein
MGIRERTSIVKVLKNAGVKAVTGIRESEIYYLPN